MKYKYTYQDWVDGNIIWNSILTNEFEDGYISKNCIEQIKLKQKYILEERALITTKSLITIYNVKRKKSIDRSQIFTNYIEAINNLFTGDVDTFKDVTFLRNYEAFMRGEEQSKEIVRKEIPPSNIDSFTKNDILIIQDAYLFFCDNNEWDYSTVEEYNRENLKVYVEFYNTANAKGYHDFVKRLRQYKGIIHNTFLSNIDDHYLGKVRKDLLDNNFIADIDRYVFIKIFKGCYLLKDERIRWLKNLDTLNYFIKKNKHNLSYQKESTTFLQIIGNCFADKKGCDLNLKTLTKATKIDNYKDLKVKLDKIISLIK